VSATSNVICPAQQNSTPAASFGRHHINDSEVVWEFQEIVFTNCVPNKALLMLSMTGGFPHTCLLKA
jgi:hypothetical protein